MLRRFHNPLRGQFLGAGQWDSVPMDSGGWHPQCSCPTRYSNGLPVCKGYEWDDTPPLAGLPLRLS